MSILTCLDVSSLNQRLLLAIIDSLFESMWASLVAQLLKNSPAMQETPFDSWAGKICWRRDRLPAPIFLGFPGSSAGKEFTCNTGDLDSIPGLRRSPGKGHGNPTPVLLPEESPRTEEPGGLQPMGLQSVRHN